MKNIVNKIMVVDRRPKDYADLQIACAHRETVFHFATTAEEAIRAAGRFCPGLWLVNVDLPDMRGRDLMAEITASRPDERVWLVADEYSVADEIDARTAGASMFLCKPICAFTAAIGIHGFEYWNNGSPPCDERTATSNFIFATESLPEGRPRECEGLTKN